MAMVVGDMLRLMATLSRIQDSRALGFQDMLQQALMLKTELPRSEERKSDK